MRDLRHIPVSYRSGTTGEEIGKSQSQVVDPTAEEAAMIQQGRVCGDCTYFDYAEGQAQIQSQRFVERLIREDNWQVKHLVSPVNQLGVCGAHASGAGSDQTMTGRMHKACDQYRPDNGKVR